MGFKLERIGDGRQKCPETRLIPVTFTADTTLAEGDIVCAMNTQGAASSYTMSITYAKLGHQTDTKSAFISALYFVTKAATLTADTEGTIEVFDITPEMIFSIPVAATIASSKVGGEYILNSSGKLSTTIAGTGANQEHRYRGVILFDRNGADAADKLALVTFPRNLC